MRARLGAWCAHQQRTVAREAGIVFTLQMPAALPPQGKDARLALYRVVQEALTNVVKHSKATHCRVEINTASGKLELHVEDDSVGLPGSVGQRGHGLPGIAERLHMEGGKLDIGPAQAGAGLRLRISLPLPAPQQPQAQAQEKIS
jgi:signal transduction histidine kinase